MQRHIRHTSADCQAWHQDGLAIIPEFFSADEIAPIVADYDALYGSRRNQLDTSMPLDKKPPGTIGASHAKQFLNIDSLPYAGSAAINLIGLHPALITYAQDLLGVEQVRLYQSHSWAKFTGEADYDQAFHCDFGNHTLTVPAANPADRTVDFILYFTQVTDGHGALHYVTKPDADRLLRPGALTVPDDKQHALKQLERSAAGPAGTLVAHSIDTLHRGTNLTTPGGYRYTMTVGYKAAGNDNIGFHTWQAGADKPWDLIFANANAQQLGCLGIPSPGDPYWDERTLKLNQARWPMWDMQEYFAAAHQD